MREAPSLPSTPRIFRNSTLYGKVESYLSKKWKRSCGQGQRSALISRPIDLAARLSAAVFDPATNGRGLRERQGRRARASNALSRFLDHRLPQPHLGGVPIMGNMPQR